MKKILKNVTYAYNNILRKENTTFHCVNCKLVKT